MFLKRDAYAVMGLPKYTLMGLVVTCLSVSADPLKQKPQSLNFSPTKNAQLDEIKPDVVPIFLYAREDSLDGDYNFKYETGNGIFAEERGVMMNKGTENEASSVSGSYRYTSPEGIPIEVTYTAGVDGFKAYGVHLPVAATAYAAKSLPQSNAGSGPFARPQYRVDNSEPTASYPQLTPTLYAQPTSASYTTPTLAPGGTEAVAPVQTSANGGSESQERPVKTPAAEYYPSQQPQQPLTVTYPPQQQASASLPQQLQPVQAQQSAEPAKPAATPQPQQAVQNSLVSRPSDYYSPPPSPPPQQSQQFQQPSVPYPRPQQAFTAPATVPQPQPQQAYPQPQPQQPYPQPQMQQAYPQPLPQQSYPQPQQSFSTPQPTGRVPTTAPRAVRPGYPGAQQQWFNARPLQPQGYGPQQRPAPARQFAVEPQQVRYVPQGRYYQTPRAGPEPPRY